jgi:hypothetical protein
MTGERVCLWAKKYPMAAHSNSVTIELPIETTALAFCLLPVARRWLCLGHQWRGLGHRPH